MRSRPGRFGDAVTSLVADGPAAVLDEPTPIVEIDGIVFAATGKASWSIADRDRAWDSSAAEGRLRTWAGVDADEPSSSAWTKYASVHFWTDPDANDTLGGYKLPFCDVIDGTVTAIPKAIFACAAAIQGSRGGVDIPSDDVDGVKSRIAGYYTKMAAKFDDDSIKPPWEDDGAAVRVAAGAGIADEFTITDPDGNQRTFRRVEPDPEPAPVMVPGRRSIESWRRDVDGDNEITDPDVLQAMVATAFRAHGGQEAWEALRERKGLTAATNADGTITPAAWHAHLCIEGMRTDDGRELMYGAGRYPDLPVSLRLLIEDEGGHWGAVTCGRIDEMTVEPVSDCCQFHNGAGMFGSDPNGQLAELLVEEQTQRFISIDPRDVSVEEIITSRSVIVDGVSVLDDDECYDIWWRFTDYVIGAATIVATPALPQAVITLADVPLPESPIAMESAPAGLPVESEGGGDVIIVIDSDGGDTIEVEVAAAACCGAECGCRGMTCEASGTCGADCTCGCEGMAAAPTRPAATARRASAAPTGPASWMFTNPGFHVGDPRLVLQSDERSYACPLTVSDPDPETGYRHVFGHVAWWNCDHTGFPGQRVKPPHSRANYAYYMTGPGVECSDGTRVEGVGNITMGCGHAPMSKMDAGRRRNLSAAEAVAHYDGGYGAIQAAWVKAGEDDFGPWIAGAIRPQLSETELRDFMTLSLSGDWREIASNLEMLAVLAVPVPGFPIRRALAASGTPEVEEYDTKVGWADDEAVALVAAGIVRRVDPMQRMTSIEQRLAAQDARLGLVERALVAQRRAQYGL